MAYIEAISKLDTSDANAGAGDILATKTAYVDGEKVTGEMANNGAVSGTISTKAGTYTVPSGYHNGSGTVAIASAEQNKIIASNIKSGVTILGVSGSVSPAKEEQTKSVTATTSTQTVSPDTGKVLSSVTVNPQVHSGTYTPTGYSNANDMGAQHNYRYVDTSGYEPTDVRPSNGSPVAVSIGDNIKITDENGYAIRDYTAVTPDNSTPVSMSKYDIAKFDASGVIVKNVTNATPSDSSPVSVNSSEIIHPTASGYLYSTTQKPEIVVTGASRASNTTSWTLSTPDDAISTPTSYTTYYDPKYFSYTKSTGVFKALQDISTVYVSLYADRGRTSSGGNVYSGIQIRKNGTTLTSAYDGSASVGLKYQFSLAKNDEITFYTRASSTTQGYCLTYYTLITYLDHLIGG